ncbi:MAG: ABC transporter permease [bacterium]|nr:ABC transporter permease [bacterium]
MPALADDLRLFRRIVSASIRSQMQYKTSFVTGLAIDSLTVFSEFLPVYFMVIKFGSLQGWSILELCILYGMVEISWAVVENLFRGFEDFGPYLIRGDVDCWLLRPRSLILQVAANEFELRRLGRVLQGCVVLAIGGIGLEFGLASWSWLALGIFGGIFFFTGVVMLGAASQFWTLGQTSELQNMLTYGGSAALTYPVSIYTRWFRRVITYAIPLAFVNYFPALAALGRLEEAGVPYWVPWMSPFVCIGVLYLARICFDAGLKRYESTGS